MNLTRAEYEAILRWDLNAFTERTFAELNPQIGFVPAAHIEVIAAMLQAVSRGEITRLIINLPPRHLKSLCASVAFPAWYLGHHPSAHVICASYGQELADKLARDCRAVMTSRWYQGLFPTRLAGRTAIHDFTTTANGGRMATSVGGVLTGRGADLIVIDDPLKPDEALSASRRTAVNEWYDNSLLSRLDDKARGAIVIVMQRLHQDDLVGHVLEQGRWDVLSFAAIAEEDETHRIDTFYGQRCFRRRTGEALQPERESLATLAAIRQTIGDYNFSAQYQQSPVPLGGALVKRHWLRFYDEGDRPARFSHIVQSWDTANKASELNDFSVCTTWGVLNRPTSTCSMSFGSVSTIPICAGGWRIWHDATPLPTSSSRTGRRERSCCRTCAGQSSGCVPTHRRPQPTRSCVSTRRVQCSKTASSSCPAPPRGSPPTSTRSPAFPAAAMTTRSTQPPRHSTTSAPTIPSRSGNASPGERDAIHPLADVAC